MAKAPLSFPLEVQHPDDLSPCFRHQINPSGESVIFPIHFLSCPTVDRNSLSSVIWYRPSAITDRARFSKSGCILRDSTPDEETASFASLFAGLNHPIFLIPPKKGPRMSYPCACPRLFPAHLDQGSHQFRRLVQLCDWHPFFGGVNLFITDGQIDCGNAMTGDDVGIAAAAAGQ